MLYKKLQLLGDLRQTLSNQAKPVAYVAGKVTGLPIEVVKAKFKQAETFMQLQGYTVLNPCNFMSNAEDWQFAMKLCIALLSMADVLYLQIDWSDSTGAKIEFEVAKQLGIDVIFE